MRTIRVTGAALQQLNTTGCMMYVDLIGGSFEAVVNCYMILIDRKVTYNLNNFISWILESTAADIIKM